MNEIEALRKAREAVSRAIEAAEAAKSVTDKLPAGIAVFDVTVAIYRLQNVLENIEEKIREGGQ